MNLWVNTFHWQKQWMTGKTELIKTINRLDHNILYFKLDEVDTVNALQKSLAHQVLQ